MKPYHIANRLLYNNLQKDLFKVLEIFFTSTVRKHNSIKQSFNFLDFIIRGLLRGLSP